MLLNEAQFERARATLAGTAIGDALGVPYEFARKLGPNEIPEMKGGGLGNYAPGEWSDDTSMAVAIAEAVAGGRDLTTPEGLDIVARGFMRWYTDFSCSPPDIGNQTRAVLSATHRRLTRDPDEPVGLAMRAESRAYAVAHPGSAGNGALMRTSPVALAHLDDRVALAHAARAVAELTHGDALAGDSCVLWTEAIRIGILDGEFNIPAGLDLLPADRRRKWERWLHAAKTEDPLSFSPNGFTVTALQAAAAAILQTPRNGRRHFIDSLYAAIRIGNDTDTVAAIAGGLLGSVLDSHAMYRDWLDAVHGWPYVDGRPTRVADLYALASHLAPERWTSEG
ncbi:hypothetical protein GCM10009624_24310 [Gordonia sinesedis]